MAVEQTLDLAKLGAGIAIGFGAIGAGLGLGIATKGVLDAIARQPEIKAEAFKNFYYRCRFSRSYSYLCFIYRNYVNF